MINPGTMLGDRYEILELIGTGGMADVYKAKCHKLNRYVAIKVLKAEYASNKNFVSKFRAEAQSAAGLAHPNIVNVYDVGDENGMYYFVMELVEGITLKNYIEKKIRLSYKEALSIAIQVAMGIEAAHNNGIIHRDIKPQNIIISREGKVKVADFGIARAATSNTITSHAMGSVHYTSPEQARGGYSDAKSDIYSIGITLFEMVTGHVPFDGENTVAIAIKHIQEEMPSPRIYVSDLPVCIEKIIFKCTQKNSDRRYSNMSELISDFKHALRNPDDDFVVINEPPSNEGTKIINDSERMEIKGAQAEPIMNQNRAPIQGYEANMGYGGAGYNQAYQGVPMQNGYQQPGLYNQMPQQQMNANNQAAYGYSGMPYDNGMAAGNYQDNNYDDYGESEEFFMPRQSSKSYDNKSGRGRMVDDNYDDYQGRKRAPSGKREEAPRKRSRGDMYSDYGSDGYDGYDSYEGESEPKMEKFVTVIMVVAAIIIALVAFFFVGKLLGFFGSSSDEGKITVPNFVGLTVEEGNALLAELELENDVTATLAESTEYEEGIIISQTPEEGTEIEPDTAIALVVSSGKVESEDDSNEDEEATEEPAGKVTVPDVVGMSEAEATVAIQNEGFVVVKQEEFSANYEKGNVTRQTPLGANTADKGSEVTIFISAGKEEIDVTVPDLTGKTEEEAKKVLSDLGLTCNSVSEENSTTIQQGYVCRQSTEAGATVTEGSNVDIWISLGVPGFKCSVDVSAPTNYLSGTDAIIVLMDAGGNELGRASTASFPYHFEKTGIIGSSNGFVSVTYLNQDAQWETTSMVAVAFTEGN